MKINRYWKLLSLIFCYYLVNQGFVQAQTYASKGSMEYKQGADIGETIVLTGMSYKGKPYVTKSLDKTKEEALNASFNQFDCHTFVEQVLAIGLASETQNADMEAAFQRYLLRIRYRGGKLNGYASRLHYFSDWAQDNERKGLLVNVSKDLGGEPFKKNLNYMSAHRSAYSPLKDEATYKQIQQVEAQLAKTTFYRIPKSKVRAAENLIKDGDILAICTARTGLDVSHEGFAVRKNGRVHLLHASSRHKGVVLCSVPITSYLNRSSRYLGLIVLRPKVQ